MSYERTLTAQVPKPATGRLWQAAALLEAPAPEGPWVAIEAVPGETTEKGEPTGVVVDTITSRHAVHNPGWYRLQWYDDGQNSKFSKPVRLSDETSPGRWN